MKRKSLLALLCCLLACGLVFAACGGNDGGPLESPTIDSSTTLEQVNKIITEGKNYTLTMSYEVNGVSQSKNTTVTDDKIVDVVTFVSDGKQVVETSACTKEGDKYYEYINRKISEARLASSGQTQASGQLVAPEINSKREVTKEYYDAKYHEVVNVYIPLMDSANYELKDGKYVLKEDKVEEFAARMGTSVAEAKKVSINIVDGKASLSAPDVEILGKKGLSVDVTPVTEKVELPADMKAAPVEGLTLANAYDRSLRGMHLAVTTQDSKIDIWYDGMNFLGQNVRQGITMYSALAFDGGKYFNMGTVYSSQNGQAPTISYEKYEVSAPDFEKMTASVLQMYRMYLYPSFWKLSGSRYVIDSAKQTEIKRVLAKALGYGMTEEQAADLAEGAYEEIKNTTFTIENDKIVYTLVVGDETGNLVIDELGSAKFELPNEVKNAKLVKNENFVPKPDSDEEKPAVKLTIDNLYGTLVKEGFSANAVLYGDNCRLTYDGKAMMLEMDGAVQAVAQQDGKYYAYTKEGDQAYRQELSAEEMKEFLDSGLRGVLNAIACSPSCFELSNGKYVVKESQYGKYVQETGNAVKPESVSVTFGTDTVVFGGLDGNGSKVEISVSVASVGSAKVVIPDELLNAPVEEPAPPVPPVYERRVSIIIFAPEADRAEIVHQFDFICGEGVETVSEKGIREEMEQHGFAADGVRFFGDKELTKPFDFSAALDYDTPIFALGDYLRIRIEAVDGGFEAFVTTKGTVEQVRKQLEEKFDYNLTALYADAERTQPFDFANAEQDLTVYAEGQDKMLVISVDIEGFGRFDLRFERGTVVTEQMLRAKLMEEYKTEAGKFFVYNEAKEKVPFEFGDGITEKTYLYADPVA